ncbi:MAG: DUF4173 domain-containing protein [Oscillospiraceae bacterium]|nr:DUF4173 domain-containing protein [Oscillospiraceae bacterium]
MDEMNNQVPNWQGYPPPQYGPPPYYYPPAPPKITYPTGKGELIFGAVILLFSLLVCNCLLFAGANLGFGIAILGILAASAVYLWSRGHRFDWYTGSLLFLCAVITAGFGRSDDAGMKFLMVLALMLVPGLIFCVVSGQNRRSPAGFLSLLDSPRATFLFGFGRMGEAGRGLGQAFRSTGTVGKKGGAVALGLLIAVPVVAIVVPLLMSADAAFEGLLDLLPEFELRELVTTVIFGGGLGWILYVRGVALHHTVKPPETAKKAAKGLHPLTVNTVLFAVALVYVAYLLSQLAYFVGGFSGILPEDFTMAEYARRGFFEMGWLCAINLGIIALAVGLVRKDEKASLLTRLVCLFLGLITVFLVATASAKMLMYIGSYGLTRARVMTEVFMLWLAASTIFVCVWLFRPKLPYMKLTLLLGLTLCAALFWADVDSQVARYNVRAYQDGRLKTVDVDYLGTLSSGAVPWLEELVEDEDEKISNQAWNTLSCYYLNDTEDIRSWNYARARAEGLLALYQPEAYGETEDLP